MGMFDNADDRAAFLMAAGLGMLASPGGNPWQSLGRGGLVGLQTMYENQQNRRRNALEDVETRFKEMQIQAAKDAMARNQAIQSRLGQIPNQLGPTTTQAQMPSPAPGAIGGGGMGGGPASLFGPSAQPGPVGGGTVNVTSPPSMGDVYRATAEVYRLAGDPENAARYIEAATKLDPEWDTTVHRDSGGNAVVFNKKNPSDYRVLPFKPAEKIGYVVAGGVSYPSGEYSGIAPNAVGIKHAPTESDRIAMLNYNLSRDRFNKEQAEKKAPRFIESTGQSLIPDVNEPSGYRAVTVPGYQPKQEKQTDVESQRGAYLDNMRYAEQNLGELAKKGFTGAGLKSEIEVGLTRRRGLDAALTKQFFVSPQAHDYASAKDMWIAGYLAFMSSRGANVPENAYELADRQFFAGAGETDEDARKKAEARAEVIKNFAPATGIVRAGPKAPEPAAAAATARPPAGEKLFIGKVVKGLAYTGGDPNDPKNWVKAQ